MRAHPLPLRATTLAGLALLATALPPGVISTSGDVAVIAAPVSVEEGELESDAAIQAFPEQQGVVLTAPLAVDLTTPGTYGTPTSPGNIAAGTVVNSYFPQSEIGLDVVYPFGPKMQQIAGFLANLSLSVMKLEQKFLFEMFTYLGIDKEIPGAKILGIDIYMADLTADSACLMFVPTKSAVSGNVADWITAPLSALLVAVCE